MTLLVDWLAREGDLLLGWWLWIALAGLACWPLCLRLFAGLPDRGYTLARALGMLLVTWLFWLLGSYGFLDNSRGSLVLCWLLTLSASLALYFRAGDAGLLVAWWRENRSLVLICELLFAGLFFAWAWYRAHQNSLIGTEKPMELAFLSAAQRSLSFPPDDPWMSGYAISYYYMGYVMSAALAKLSGISSAIAFNLTNASLFALSGLGAFGLAYNLVRARFFNLASTGRYARNGALASGIFALLMLALMGNFQFALIEAPMQTGAAPRSYLEFWRTQSLPDLEAINYQQQASADLAFDTSSWNHWWWFKASRVPTDFDLEGRLTGIQPIGEFPAFSFLLADNHPHVLALPFFLCALGLMLNLVLSGASPGRAEILVAGLALGGLAFLNAWDAPTMLMGLIGAEALRRLMTSEAGRLSSWDWLACASFGLQLAAIGLLAYLPYWIGLRSQAAGVLPNLLHPSQFRHFFIMFGPLLVIIGIYLAVELWRGHQVRRLNWKLGLSAAALLLAVSLLVMILLGVVLALRSPGGFIVGNLSRPQAGYGELVGQLVERRVEYGLTALLLLACLAAAVARLFPSQEPASDYGEVAITWIKYPPSTGFALLLIGMALCLSLFCEFFYLRDNFFVRINTVFKLYYQAWALWSIAAAYALVSILADRGLPKPHLVLRFGLAALFALSILAGLAYTIAGIHHRAWIESGRQHAASHRRFIPPAHWVNPLRHIAEGEIVAPGTVLFSRVNLADAVQADLLIADAAGIAVLADGAIIIYEPLTLDGAGGLLDADDQNVIKCLHESLGRGDAIVAEAVGEAYNIAFGRVGALAGIPIVLGWENHQRQWRGGSYGDAAGTRAADLRALYTSHELWEAQPIIERYGITHILYGATERQAYGSAGEDKFQDNLPTLCESGRSRIYYSG